MVTVNKPPDFVAEGTALAAAISAVFLDHAEKMNLLDRTFTDFCQTAEDDPARRRYPEVKAQMKQLLKTKRLPAALVEEMRKLCDYRERVKQKIISQVDQSVKASLIDNPS